MSDLIMRYDTTALLRKARQDSLIRIEHEEGSRADTTRWLGSRLEGEAKSASALPQAPDEAGARLDTGDLGMNCAHSHEGKSNGIPATLSSRPLHSFPDGKEGIDGVARASGI